MLNRTFIAAMLFALLGACDRQEPVPARVAPAIVAPASDAKTISVAPEHFDRVRAEQVEKEEERLRRRSRPN